MCQVFSSIFSFISEQRGSFHEGSFDPAYGELYNKNDGFCTKSDGLCTSNVFLTGYRSLFIVHFIVHDSFVHFAGYFYVAMLKSVSQGWALWCLVYFEHSCAEFLAPVKPMPKFWSIKLVVLATFWQSIVISILTRVDMMPWQTIYDQCYANPEDGKEGNALALHRMTNPITEAINGGIGVESQCADAAACYTDPRYLHVFQTFGGVPCVTGLHDGVEIPGWNQTVVDWVGSNTSRWGLSKTVTELQAKCSQSCLSSQYCVNPLDECHPWCDSYEKGFTDFFPFCASKVYRPTDRSTFDFCARDTAKRAAGVAEGLSEDEAKEEVGSRCLSTFNDDIGNIEKFMEKSNVQLQNLMVCIEMFIAAIAHRSVFSYRDYKSGQTHTMVRVRCCLLCMYMPVIDRPLSSCRSALYVHAGD